MTKSMKMHFFRVTMPSGCRYPLEELLLHLYEKVDAGRRTSEIGGTPVRLQELFVGADVIEGDFVRIRMHLVPVKASTEGNIAPFELAEDEGVGEQTAFIYDRRSRVVALQRNYVGVTPFSFAAYIERFYRTVIEGGVVLEPILELDTLRKLETIEDVRRFNYRVAPVDSTRAGGPGVASAIEITSHFHAPNVEVTVSMGKKKKGSLSTDRVKATARRLLQMADEPGDAVERIIVTGKFEDGEWGTLDLLKDRMEEVVPMEMGSDRSVPYHRRRAAMREGWARREEELRSAKWSDR